MTRKYSATFPDGTVLKRESDRIYSHAWRLVFPDGRAGQDGFSASRELAAKGAASYQRYSSNRAARIEIVEATFVEKKPRGPAATPKVIDAPVIAHEGDTWYVLAKGVTREDGKVYMHLSSTTRGVQVKHGVQPVQTCDWIDPASLPATA